MYDYCDISEIDPIVYLSKFSQNIMESVCLQINPNLTTMKDMSVFDKINKCFLGSELYSKNKTILFVIIFLFVIAIFSHTKITIFVYQVKNTYVRNILISVTRPFTDFAKTLPFEKAFTKTRNEILAYLDLDDDYHWDNFYYDEKELSISTSLVYSKKNSQKLQEQSSKNITGLNNNINDNTLAGTAFNLQNKTNTDNNSNDELIVANYEYTKKKPLKILFAGDSQMQSLVEGFKRNVGVNSPFAVTELAVISSGFVRTDYYNWPAKFNAIFQQAKNEGQPFDVVVLIMGMNDCQNFFDGNGNLFKCGSEEWVSAYGEKIKNVMDVLQKNVKKVYWLGLPIVKSPALNAEINFVENAQIKALPILDSSKVRRISVREIAPGKNANYSDSIQTSDGNRITFMQGDGVHFTFAGSSYIMREIEKHIRRDFYIDNTK